MSSAGDIRAGRAFVELGLKGMDKVRAGLKRLGSIVKKGLDIVAKAATALAAAAATAVATFVKMGDEIDKAMQRTGLGARELTQLKHAAEEADVSFKSLQNGLFRMQRLRPGKTFEQVADEVANAGDAGEQAAKAYEIFGREGKELLPLLKQGSKLIREQRQEAERLGIVMTDEQAKAAAQLGDDLASVAKQIKMIVFQTGRWIAENIKLVEKLKGIQEVLGDLLVFLRDDEIGKAFKMVWLGVEHAYVSFLKGLSDTFVEGFLNVIRELLHGMASAARDIANFITGGGAPAWMNDLIEIFSEPIELATDLDDRLEEIAEEMNKLMKDAERRRMKIKTSTGMGEGALAGFAAGTGTFDPSLVLRRHIATGGDNPMKRTADATERTARATESIEKIFRKGLKIPAFR